MVLTAIIIGTAFLGLYWALYGQRRYNDMFVPKRKTKLKAVLFDLDGVLIDSFERQNTVFNDLRVKFGLKEIGEKEFREKLWGNSLEVNAKKYFGEYDLKELHTAYDNLVKKHVGKSKLIDRAKDVLETIKKKKIKIGLATNTTAERAANDLGFHKIKHYFDAIITADDVEKPKPYPDLIIKLCETLNVMPDETIFIGDTKNDYKAGKAAGSFVVGINTTGGLVIDKLSDMLDLV